MRLRTLIRWSAIACGVLTLALAVFILSFDLNQYRRPLEAAASKALGRTVTLSGPLTLAISLSPTIAAEQIRIANPAWASRPHLAEAAHAEIQIDLLPLLREQLVTRQIGLDEADILFEATSDGTNLDIRREDGRPAQHSPAAQFFDDYRSALNSRLPLPDIKYRTHLNHRQRSYG